MPKHLLNKTIELLKWLEKEDIPEKLWESYKKDLDNICIKINYLKLYKFLIDEENEKRD